jgi:hypothetical protein
MLHKANRLLGALAFAVLALSLLTPAFGQAVNDAYNVGYFDHFRGVRFINTGQIGSPIDPATKQGTVCADTYIFDANQEMLACCSCPLTANELDGLTSVSILTGVTVPRGVIKVVADASCDETNITAPVPGGLRVFGKNAQSAAAVTEYVYPSAPLTSTEQQFLGQACSFVHYLGSGKGVCHCHEPIVDLVELGNQ